MTNLPPVAADTRPWLRPASAFLILGVDWAFFGADVFSLGASVVVSSFAAFAVTAAGVFWIQRRSNGDSRFAATTKALFGGIVAGVPTSIGGTIVAAVVLFLAGMSHWNARPRLKDPGLK